MLILLVKPSTSSVDGGSKAGAVLRPITIASPPVGRDACVEFANDIVQASFKFIVVVLVYTVYVGVSPIGLESPDPYLLRKQIQGVSGD